MTIDRTDFVCWVLDRGTYVRKGQYPSMQYAQRRADELATRYPEVRILPRGDKPQPPGGLPPRGLTADEWAALGPRRLLVVDGIVSVDKARELLRRDDERGAYGKGKEG